ncbi:MAG: hypothetical protein PHH58_13925 [Rhodoferax sp.]|nr:hypothetical protein [Rhodoferax sp.]
MSSTFDTANQPEAALPGVASHEVLAREAGVPFKTAVNSNAEVNPIAEWLSLMEVVQLLCPAWPVRDKPMQGNNWRL